MSLDLNDLLRDWPHEPGLIKVRRIMGTDGREKLQLRIDLGLIQMETAGRPDGLEPHARESLLAYHQERAKKAAKKSEPYVLSADDVSELQQEGIQYYHRYISFFQLNDYRGVIRDTLGTGLGAKPICNTDVFCFAPPDLPTAELPPGVAVKPKVVELPAASDPFQLSLRTV